MIIHLNSSLRAKFPLTVDGLMSSPVVSVDIDDSLIVARSVMRELGIHHVAATREGELRGVVSSRDLLRAAEVEGTRVVHVMSRSPHTAQPHEPLSLAAGRMVRHEVSCLPVLDGDQHIVGMVTLTDFVECAQLLLGPPIGKLMTPCPLVTVGTTTTLEEAHRTMLREQVHHLVVMDHTAVVGVLSDLDTLQPGGSTVQSCMARDVIVASPETTIHDAAHRMLSNRIGALPVINNNHRLVGIFTRRDLLLAVASFTAGRTPTDEEEDVVHA